MERHLVNAPATISRGWYEGGVLVDPSTVTIKIDRADGTNLIPAGTATSGTGAAARTYTLSIANMASLDILTATWTSATKGTLTSTVEVVGGFLFSIADMRALGDPYSDTTKYPAAKVAEVRTLAEQTIEDPCGIAFVPRYARETLSGSGSSIQLAKWPRVRSVRSATVDGVALTGTDLTDLKANLAGELYRESYWTGGFNTIVVGYEHGYDTPPARVSQACLTLAKNWLVTGPLDDRMTSLSTEDGTFAMLTPGLRGSVVGIPEVDAVIQQYGGYNIGIA